MSCSALLCGRFADSQESRFQASKRSNMSSAVLEGVHSADIHEFCIQATKRSDMDCVELQGCLFADRQEWRFQAKNLSEMCSAVPQLRNMLMLGNRVFKLRIVQTWAMLS